VTERVLATPEAIERAAALIRAGRLVAFPTETVYGLGARADDAAAVARIFTAKGRPATNPLIAHVADEDAACALAASWPEAAHALATAFWPGPLTLVVEKRRGPGGLVDAATAGGGTAALRVPAHPVALALIRAAGVPIAAPSANRSTAISPTTAEHVVKSLGGRVDLVLDGGPTRRGIESTIVDVTRDPAVLLRPGAIPITALAQVARVADPGAIVVAEGERAAAPGAHAKHYAPRARVRMTAPGRVGEEVEAARSGGVVAGAIERAPGSGLGEPCAILPDDPEGYAAGLYAALHRLDDAGCALIVLAEVPEGPLWAAVRDRLRRAAA
jgi:L-threonylcarbamoyladenylate synthase